MIEKIQLTLYDIFGYLLPGSITASALFIFYWALCIPTAVFAAYKLNPDGTGWTALIALSYVIGHIGQGIGNSFLRGAENAALGPKGSIPVEIREIALTRAATLMGVDRSGIDPVCLFRFADEYSLQKGAIGYRDIFVYREGFYRGCTVAFVMLGLALIVRTIYKGTAVAMPSYIYFIPRTQIFAGALLAGLAAMICRQRFYRFGAYRVTRAIFAFLALQESKKEVA